MDTFWRRQQSVLTGVLDELIPFASRVCYLDYPVYSNVGDLLIYHGTEAWLAQRHCEVITRRSIYDFRFLPMARDVTILCQGGGNFGDRYRHQALREAVVARYPGNRVVFLPQTLHYRSAARLEQSSQRLNAHGDLHLLLRDRTSHAIAQAHFPRCNTYLVPDMAVMLYPIPCGDAPTERFSRLCLFRRDAERRRQASPPTLGRCDWEGDWKQLLGSHYIALRVFQALIMLVGRWGPAVQSAILWRRFTARVLRHCVASLHTADCVETSRLHGHILASLLGVPSRLHDNNYGKNSAYYRCWHTEMPIHGQTLVTDTQCTR